MKNIRDLHMDRKEADEKLVGLRYRSVILEKELEDRRNLERGVIGVDSPRPLSLRPAREIEKELAAVNDEIDSLEKAMGNTAATRMSSTRGDLKSSVAKWAKNQGFKQGESVSRKKIDKFVRDVKLEGIETNRDSVRATLSRLGYSTEKGTSDET